MSFKRYSSRAVWRGGFLASAVIFALAVPGVAERTPVPSVRIPLDQLGFPGYVSALLHTGASMATVHLLDNTHLLFTYSTRSLVPRLPGDDERDSDRLVAAEVVGIPDGKVLARTIWHLHDHGQYLWSVGHGVFVLRMGEELATFMPLRGLATGDAFQRVALPHHPGHPRLVAGSPDGKVVVVQIQKDNPYEEETAQGDAPHSKHTVVEFYRVKTPASAEEPVVLQRAGIVLSPNLLRIALDGDGYLWAEDGRRNTWKVSFNEYEGKPQELAAISSSCSPRLDLVSRSQFLVTTCRGTDDSHMLAAYGFDGHETWQEPFGEVAQAPAIVTAPDAGRFAMSTLSVPSGSGLTNFGYVPYDSLTQQIRVYQTESGDLLLNLPCIPVVKTSENFDLSADGRMLAVLGKSAIELYKLPELTSRDRKELAEVQSMAPPTSEAPVFLKRIVRPIGGAEEVRGAEDADAGAGSARSLLPVPSASTPAGSAQDAGAPAKAAIADGRGASAGSPVQGSQGAVAAPAPEAPRKPPTLLAPGEKQEFKVPPAANTSQ